MLVNKRELAEILGKTERSLTHWQKDGLPIAKRRGKIGEENGYDLGAVISWLVARRTSRFSDDSAAGRLAGMRAAREEAALHRELAELVDPGEVREAIGEWTARAIALLDRVPDRFLPKLQEAVAAGDLHAGLQTIAREIQADLAALQIDAEAC